LHAQAQPPARLLFGGDPRVPPRAQQRLAQLFSQLGPVVATTTPPQPGDIAIIAGLVTALDGATLLRLTYYDGVSARALLGDELPLPRGDLPREYESYILGRAQTALAMVAAQTPVAPFAPPMQIAPRAPMATPAPRTPVPPPRAPSPVPEQADRPEQPEPELEAQAEGGTEEGEPSPQAPESGRPVVGGLALGAGPGMHQAQLPTDSGSHRLPLAAFPALDLLLRVDGVTHDGNVTPGVRLSYRTSVGYTLTDSAPDSQKISTPARTHELLLDAVVNINLGDSRRDVSLPISLGWAMNNTRTDVEISWPRYTLAGPHLRALVRVPMARGAAVLTLGPDAEWIVQISSSLQSVGLGPTGYAIGAEAEFAVRLSDRFALRAFFREARASISSARVSGAFSDVQRFITFGLEATF
jgi:hypothetical protein